MSSKISDPEPITAAAVAAPCVRPRDLTFAVGAILLIAAVLCLPMLLYGAPNGHSIEYNLVWLREFSEQLLEGNVYPRWLVDMNRGAGSPVFFFYGSLPFYISSVGALVCPSCKVVVQLGIGEWLLLALSGLAFFHFARRRFDLVPAVFGALLYMALPYHFEIDLWRRQAIGELSTYIWMPLVLHYVGKLSVGEDAIGGLAVAYALLLFSHLPTALLFSVCLGVYVLLLVWRNEWRVFLARFALGIGCGVLLAGIYLVPALFAEQYISTTKLWTPYFDFHRWFWPGADSPDPRFTGRLFPILELTTVIFAAFWLNAYRCRRELGACAHLGLRAIGTWLAFAGFAWFLMTPLSVWVWETAPFLWKVQFPWRIAVVLDVATAVISLYTLQLLQRRRDGVSLAVVGIATALLLFCVYSGRDVVRNLDSLENPGYLAGRDAAVSRGVDAPEYAPAWSKTFADDPKGEIASMPRVRLDPAKGEVEVVEWEPRHIVMWVNLREPAELKVRQFYFPGWEAEKMDGEIELKIEPSVPAGLLDISAPAGRYRIALKLEPLPQELAGGAISALGLLLLWLWARRRARGSAPAVR